MLQEFFPILEGAPMGELWVLLAWAGLLMIAWMFVIWIGQRRRRAGGMEQFGWTSGLACLAVLYAIQGSGYGPRRFLVALMMTLSAGYLARRSWVLGQPAEPAGIRRLFFFECRALLALVLSLPVALLVLDPWPAITRYEWAGLLLWGIGMAGQILAESRAAFCAWLVWLSFTVAALETPYGAWTFVCPLIMLPFLRRSEPPSGEDDPSPVS